MVSKTVALVNPTGLHARPAAALAHETTRFTSKIEIRNASKNGPLKDAKSMIAIMTAGIAMGDAVEIVAEDEDEAAAVDALVKLIGSGFDE